MAPELCKNQVKINNRFTATKGTTGSLKHFLQQHKKVEYGMKIDV